jgi:hypothetical protein
MAREFESVASLPNIIFLPDWDRGWRLTGLGLVEEWIYSHVIIPDLPIRIPF